MRIAQRHPYIGMTEHSRDDGHRYAVHHRMAGVRVAKIVKTDILDAGFPTDAMPQPEIVAARPRWIERRRKHERAVCPRLPFEYLPGLSVERNPPRSRLAVRKTAYSPNSL